MNRSSSVEIDHRDLLVGSGLPLSLETLGRLFTDLAHAVQRRDRRAIAELRRAHRFIGRVYWRSSDWRKKIPAAMRQAVFARDGWACCGCGATSRLEIDHVVPVSKGGTDALSNLQTLCKTCNCSKGARR